MTLILQRLNTTVPLITYFLVLLSAHTLRSLLSSQLRTFGTVGRRGPSYAFYTPRSPTHLSTVGRGRDLRLVGVAIRIIIKSSHHGQLVYGVAG